MADMTKEDFIDLWANNAGVDPEHRTPDGLTLGEGFDMEALPCTCDDAQCLGWAMVRKSGPLRAYHEREERTRQRERERRAAR